MNATSMITSQYSYYPTATTQRRQLRRQAAPRIERITPIETSDELGRKQEVVCGAILGLSLVSSVVVCFWQLAIA